MSVEITKLALSPKDQNTFYAEFDDGEKLTVAAAIVADYSLYKGRVLENGEYGALKKDVRLTSAKARALRIIGKRQMSRREITARLVQKGESEQTAATVADWLVQIGAINDGEYAAMIVRHYAASGYGAMRVRDELYRRGIERERWDEVLVDLPDMEEAAFKAITSKLKGKKPDKAELGRVHAWLNRRGFKWDEIKAAAERYMNEGIDADE